MPRNPRICLVSPARNEGPFLLEWIAWHRMIGFDDILVLTNDCTDGSDDMLDALAELGLVRHQRHYPRSDESPVRHAYRKAHKDAGVLAADWVMVMDTDEYLQVFIGDGSVHDLVLKNGQNCLGMAVNWKVFGNNSVSDWQDKFLRHQFTHAADGQVEANVFFKSIFRNPHLFDRMEEHAPVHFSEEWGGNNIWVDSEGVHIKAIRLTKPPQHYRESAKRRVTHTAAQVNHYAIKSLESFALKGTQLSGSQRIHRHNAAFLELYNCNDIEDRSALFREAAFEVEYEKLVSHPHILQMHHNCCANYVLRLCKLSNTEPNKDPRFLLHKAQAGHYWKSS